MSTSAVKHPYGVSLFASPRDNHRTTSFPSSNGRSRGTSKIAGPASSHAPLPFMQAAATEGESPGVDSAAGDRSHTGSSRAGPGQTPTLKRTHSELSVSEGAQSSNVQSDNGRGQESRKLSRLSESAAARDEASTASHPSAQQTHDEASFNDPREPGRPSSPGSKEAQDRHYTWQSSGAGGMGQSGPAGAPMSITALSSPTSRSNVPLDERGPEVSQHHPQREHPHYYQQQQSIPPPLLPSPSYGGRSRPGMESRLPGIASLSQRVTSPPPQVTRVNAPRSFVSASPGAPGSGLGRGLAHFQPGSGPGPGPMTAAGHAASYPTSPRMGLSQHTTSPQYGHHGHHPTSHLPHHSHSHSMSLPHGPSTSPILAPHAAQSCPPIHPSLVGLPGSGTGPGNKQQPSFVAKLYSMLEDENTGNMITWGPGGDVFSVANPAEFSRIILPTWFKHANWQSFVRQLNMYGFHKVNHTFSGAPNEEVQIWEFKHPSFRRGEVHLLADIKRKSSRHKRTGSQSQSFSGSIHGADFDGRGRSRSSTPIDMYGSEMMVPPMHPHSLQMHPHGFGPPDPRLRQIPIEGDFREGLPAHHRVRSLTDAAMRPPRGFTQAMREGDMMGPMHGGSPSSSRPQPHVSHIKSSSLSTGIGGPGIPAPAAGPGGYPPASTSAVAGAPLPDTEEHHKAISTHELSDRIDAIIRHSNYLETQFRSLAEDLYQTQQREAVAKTHLLRVVGRLTSVLSIAPEEESSPGTSEQMRRQMLDVCHSEINQLSGYLGLEPGVLSPPIQPRGLPPHGSSGSTPAGLPLRPGLQPPTAPSSTAAKAGPYPARPPQRPGTPEAHQRADVAGMGGAAPHSSTGSPTGESPQGRPPATSYSFPRR